MTPSEIDHALALGGDWHKFFPAAAAERIAILTALAVTVGAVILAVAAELLGRDQDAILDREPVNAIARFQHFSPELMAECEGALRDEICHATMAK